MPDPAAAYRHARSVYSFNPVQPERIMSDEQIIHVQKIPPQQRHPLIFMAFEKLAPNQGFIIVNDHDPAPLRRQFELLHSGNFNWEYLQSGPTTWRVRISRNSSGDP
ncbi:MAG TPA: DUF2249 domain-containing protein [Salinisphaeraceae bacterium]|nr:DUF2249 domain-containing protein [Salinisphaeraceae bacterium]